MMTLWQEKREISAYADLDKGGHSPKPSWFAKNLERGKRERFIGIYIVTPEIAAEMLTHNRNNRPVTRAKVAQNVARLKAGQFILVHQGLSFTRDGDLNDGQHRLLAVVESGKSAEFTITFGASREEFKVIDQGCPRNAAQLLAMGGVKNYSLSAALANTLLVLARGYTPYGAQEIHAFAEERMKESDDFSAAVRFGDVMKKVTNPTSAAVAHYIITRSGAPKEKIDEFWKDMATGELLTGVRLRLREWLLNGELSRASNQGTTIKRAAAMISAWNAWRTRHKTADFKWPSVSSLPKVKL